MFSADGGTTPANLVSEDLFSAFAFAGTNAANAIVNNINLSTYGGLTIIKCRDSSGTNMLWFDTVRGINSLTTASSNAQASATTIFSSYNSNGFSVTGSTATTNSSSNIYISHTFRQAIGFFKIVSWTGNGTTQSISHDLGFAPGMVFIKSSSAITEWAAWHRGLTSGNYLDPDTSAAQTTTNAVNNFGNNTITVDPTSTTITVGSSANVNGAGNTYIAYLWGHDTTASGMTQCGSLTTDGSGNATVTLGWEPQYVLLKRISGIEDWIVLDTARGWDLGSADKILNLNLNGTETSAQRGNPTANGFSAAGLSVSSTYVYHAVRKGLMRTPTDATKVFAINASTGTGSARTISGLSITSGPDLVISKKRSFANKHNWQDRLRGLGSQITSDSTAAETTLSDVITSFGQSSVVLGTDATAGSVNTLGETYINYFLKEATGFFQRVRYVGTGSAHTEAHNLGVVPELMLVKGYSSGTTDWQVYYGDNTKFLVLNTTAAATTGSTVWNNTSPTASVFTVGTSTAVNNSTVGYMAYLFATANGVSKVGTYTGTGTTNSISCGFSAGARFVMIKRIDSTSDWYFLDTTRGLVAASDPYLLFNSTAAEVTGNDYIDPYSPGFELSSTAPAALNANGGSFLYWAIA